MNDDHNMSGERSDRADDIFARLKRMRLSTTLDQRLAEEATWVSKGGMAYGNVGGILVVAGKPGSGKSVAIANWASQAFGDDAGTPGSKFLRVTAPSPFSPSLYAESFLRATGYPMRRMPREADLWTRVGRQLRNMMPTVVQIDEFQHLLSAGKLPGRTAEDVTNSMLDMLKIYVEEDGINFICSGTPRIIPAIRAWGESLRRFRIFEVRPVLEGDAEANELKIDLEDLCAEFGLGMIDDRSMIVARLLHATEGGIGLAIEVAKEAVYLAAVSAADTLNLKHFAQVYAKRNGGRIDDNPFLIPNFRDLRTTLISTAPSEAP